MHVTTAFLNSELKEEMYMKQPEVFVIKDQACISCVTANNIAIGEGGNNLLDCDSKHFCQGECQK